MYLSELVEGLLGGEDWAIARAITLVENDAPEIQNILAMTESEGRPAQRIGITGAMASGKSTLIAALLAEWLKEGRSVGVIAVDPTSRKSGGAFLGDRLRMIEHYRNPLFFCRSMATRGNTQGLVERLDAMMEIMRLGGKELVVVETIGASQDAIDIRRFVDTLVMVLLPTGDLITYQKAGLLEVADIVVMNYGDFPGANLSMVALRSALALRQDAGSREIPVIKTIAKDGVGVTELKDAIREHGEDIMRVGRESA